MLIQKEFMLSLASQGRRMDGRGFEEFRPIHVEKSLIEKAEGSCRVRIGETDVIAGVKLDLGTPFPDAQDKGVLMVAAELSPIAYPEFEMGPPREQAVELARVVDRGIREAKAIDLGKLCIIPKEKVWMVSIDLQIINHGGNLIDACSLASIIALLHARMPTYDGEKITWEKKAGPVPMLEKPVTVTVHKATDGVLLVDPTLDEEAFLETRLTVTAKEDGNITALQKGGKPLTVEEIEQAIGLALKKGKELRKFF